MQEYLATQDRANFRLTSKFFLQQIPIDLHILQAITEEIQDGRKNTVRIRLAGNQKLYLLSPEIATALSTDAVALVRAVFTRNQNQ